MKTLLITDFTTELANSIKNRLYDTFQIYDLGFPIGTHQLVQSRFEEIAPNCILHIGNGFEKDLTVIDTLPSDLGLFVFVSFFEYKDQRERILDKAVRDVLISRNIPYLIIGCVKPIEFYDHYIITMIHGKLCKINEHFNMKLIYEEVNERIRNKVRIQIDVEVWSQVWSQVCEQIRSQVFDKIYNPAYGQVNEQVSNQLCDKVEFQLTKII